MPFLKENPLPVDSDFCLAHAQRSVRHMRKKLEFEPPMDGERAAVDGLCHRHTRQRGGASSRSAYDCVAGVPAVLGGATTAFIAADLNGHVDVDVGVQPGSLTATNLTVQQEARGDGQLFLFRSSWVCVAPSTDGLVRTCAAR